MAQGELDDHHPLHLTAGHEGIDVIAQLAGEADGQDARYGGKQFEYGRWVAFALESAEKARCPAGF